MSFVAWLQSGLIAMKPEVIAYLITALGFCGFLLGGLMVKMTRQSGAFKWLSIAMFFLIAWGIQSTRAVERYTLEAAVINEATVDQLLQFYSYPAYHADLYAELHPLRIEHVFSLTLYQADQIFTKLNARSDLLSRHNRLQAHATLTPPKAVWLNRFFSTATTEPNGGGRYRSYCAARNKNVCTLTYAGPVRQYAGLCL